GKSSTPTTAANCKKPRSMNRRPIEEQPLLLSRKRHLTCGCLSGPCLPFPTRDPACETRCAESDTAAAKCGPVCPGHGTPEWHRDRRRDAISGPRRSDSHRKACAAQASQPSPAPCPTYVG